MTDPDTLKSIMRMFSYGLFVATSQGDDGPRAATISWVTQASFEPRLVAVGMRKGTAICLAVQKCRKLVLHVVGEHQADFAKAFFRSGQVSAEEISGYRYHLSASHMPILGGAVAWLECEVVEEAGRDGDHAVFIARILDGDIQLPGIAPLPLRETNWHYGG